MRVSRFGLWLASLWLTMGFSLLRAQPTAAFTTTSQTTSCNPLVVQFTNQSTGNNLAYEWFSGVPGVGSSSADPVFFYTDPGCYDVTLIATNTITLQSDTLVEPCFVEIFASPEPDVALDIGNGCVPLTVNITDQSTANSPGGIVDWQYTFSDGTNASVQVPNLTLTFLTADTISMFVQVTNSNGCIGFRSFPDFIIAQPAPVLDFAPDTNAACDPPFTVGYNNLTQLNGAENPSFLWEFPGGVLPGGGNTVTAFSPPPVSYNTVGNYDATLILTTDNQCDDTLSIPNVIGIGGVTADFTVSNTTICLGDSITVQSTSTGGVSITEWDFGEVPGVDTFGTTATYVYSQPGTYDITIFANNNDCGDTLVQTAVVTVQPNPTADFTVDHDFDCQPGIPFIFTDQSIDAATWDWNFGDSTTSSVQNPTHSYTGFGDFEVCLIITNVEGCQDTFCDIISIQPPDVDFETDPREGCRPLQVQFTDVSDNPGDSTVSWEWLFEAAVPPSSTQQNPIAVWDTVGEFDVSLIIETLSGCRDTLTVGDLVRVGEPPVNGFTVDKDTVCILEDITFAADSINPDWDYFWDFQYVAPGSFTLIDSTPTIAYPDTGLYDVALIVDNTGCRDTLVIPEMVYVSPPRADFTLSDSLVCGLPANVTITDQATGPVDIYEWYVNNALYSNAPNPPPLSLTNPGTYLIRQVVINSLSGCSDTLDILLLAGNPVAEFVGNTLTGCRPLSVTFDNQSQNFANSSWQFSVGGSTVEDPTFAFPDTGFYTVELTVTDQFGCTDTRTRTDYIEVIGPYAQFVGVPQNACPGDVIQFTDTSVSFGSTINSWLWTFGDTLSPNNTSSVQNPTHVYSQPGDYDVNLVVQDNQGCVDSVRFLNYISITFPEPGFTVADTSTCAGAEILFDNTSQGIGLTFEWDFGDGDTSTQASPIHSYADTGFYDVTLIATDQNGCSDTLFTPNAIYIEPFEAGFTGAPLAGLCPPLNTVFQDTSIGNVVGWQWDFGTFQGVTSVLQNPANVYFEAGLFDVELIATHEDGCRDTLLKQEYVDVGGPQGTYVVEPNDVCLGDTVCITVFTEAAILLNADTRDGAVFSAGGLSGIADTLTFCHVYSQTDTFIPVVQVLDASGCSVFYDGRDSAIVHTLPRAQIMPLDTIGCIPFAVPFADASAVGDTAITVWDWDFGNGDSADTSNPVSVFQDEQTYTVTLIVEDGFGCRDTTSSTVTAIEGTIAGFAASDTAGCAPALIDFTDQSTNVPPNTWIWAFGDGDTVVGVANPQHLYEQDGVYTVTLIVGDSIGCLDTLIRTDYIVLERPEAVVTPDQDIACTPVNVTFSADSSSSSRPIVEYEWILVELPGGNATITTTTEPILEIPFFDPGDYEIVLVITDAEGCQDTSDVSPVSIRERTTPDPIEVRNVSVVSRTAAEVRWASYIEDDFKAYAVYRIPPSGTPQQVATITDQDSLSYIDVSTALDFEAQSYCYKVLVQNTCDEFSLLEETAEHCTIELQAASQQTSIELNWSAYVGYEVVNYEIYRVEDYDTTNVTFLDIVPGTTFTYTDSNTFCRDTIRYRVLAIGARLDGRQSWSDLDAEAPELGQPTERNDIITATVVNDTVIDVSWTPYEGYKPANYVLERSLDGASWTVLDTTDLATLSFTDPNVLVDEQSYWYRATTIDSCGDVTQPGLIGKTILLDVQLPPGSETPNLSWSAYREWEFGVLEYRIEVFNEETGQFERVARVGSEERTFIDRESAQRLDQVELCYRIRGIEVGNRSAESVSNEECVILGPRLFIPNAFTPNGDDRNDNFTIVAPNIQNVEIRIYNQWGNLVYSSFSLEEGWNGRYQGRPAPEGVYVYVIRAEGFEGTVFERSGTVTLVR